jgi:Tfp pilus assembly protein PilF
MRVARALVLMSAMLLAAAVQGGPPVVIGSGGASFGRGPLVGGISFGGYYPGFYSPVPYGYNSRNTSITIYSPGSSVSPAPSTANVPPPPPETPRELREEDFPDKIIIRPGKKTILPREPIKPEMGPQPGEFRAGPPPKPKEPEPVEPPKPWWPKLQPVPEPGPRPAEPNASPAQPMIDLGKEAFSDPHREYARAELRFQRAVEIDPKNPLAYFDLAQAQFALGKYREAVANIHAGLRLQPVWPASKFSVRELYGPNGDDFAEHMRLLREALTRRPDDAALLFLYGYELWFAGQEQEARQYFQRALPLVAQPQFIQMFLQAGGMPMAAR